MLPYYLTGKILLIMSFTHRERLQTLSVFTHKIATVSNTEVGTSGHEEVTPKESRRTTKSTIRNHGEAKCCRRWLLRSPGNNKQPTVNSFRLWSGRLSVALARSCVKRSNAKLFDFGNINRTNGCASESSLQAKPFSGARGVI